MDYEKAYKEALKRAKAILKVADNRQESLDYVSTIFPELRESEDEKVRKVLIDYFNRYKEQEECGVKTFYGIPTDNILAWLEKQKDTNVLIQEASEKAYTEGMRVERKHWLEKQDKRDARYKYLEELLEADTIYQMAMNDAMVEEAKMKATEAISNMDISELLGLEKQCEQKSIKEHNACEFCEDRYGCVSPCSMKLIEEEKPTDQVEPKFHEGDFIVGTYCRGKIIALTDDAYLLDTGQGIPFSCKDNVHLWTLQDAKDGDVLINKNYMGESPFIFKETKPSNIKTDVPNPLTVLGYCGIGGAGFTKSSGWGDTANCIYYPATKEQCDLLFAKMEEARWKFDFEKKELKKVEQKPAWSEEDERIYQSIMDDTVQENQLNDKQTNWLRDIKYRYLQQPKQAWSEEDEYMLNETI